MVGRSRLRNTSSQEQCDTLIKSARDEKTRIEIEIIKYKKGKIDADQLKQKYVDMCDRLNNDVDRFEKEYKNYPEDVLDLMRSTDNTILQTQTLIDHAIGQ